MKKVMTIASLALLLTPSAAFAKTTPATLAGAQVVSATQLKTLMGANRNLLVIDARIHSEYVDGHIPGAVNYPQPQLESFKHKFPKSKAAPLAFYCNGPKCWKSYDAAKMAVSWGYSHIFWMRGGVPEWKKAGYPVVKGR